METEHAPIIVLPTELSDEAAAQLLECLHDIARVIESHYAAQLHRHYHAVDERQQDLWPDNDPPF